MKTGSATAVPGAKSSAGLQVIFRLDWQHRPRQALEIERVARLACPSVVSGGITHIRPMGFDQGG